MTVLLDTHVVLWANQKPHLLSPRVAAIVSDRSTTVLVSAATAWEIATKVRLGKLTSAVLFEQEFMEIPERTGYILLPIEPEVALRSGRLIGKHGDPFDRMIAAQALALDVPVLSSDTKLDEFGVRRIW
jgi:PIN domain nuclease of toxin-antitoxin system